MSPPPLPLEEAQARLLALATPLPVEALHPADALGRCLAEPLIAHRTQPAADLSAMDGFAMRAVDLPGPWQIVGESAAGHPFSGEVLPGEAVRIATGALVPSGADMVLLQEDAARDGDHLQLSGTPPQPPHRHIRRRGNDFQTGDLLLPVGTRLSPAGLALALAAGHATVMVHRQPRIVIIDTGDELASAPDSCPDDRIPASNGTMLAAMADGMAGSIIRLGPVPDRRDALVAALDAAHSADVIITSGGASVGDHDLIKPALEAFGASVDFWKVAIKPGKPLLVARRGRQIIIGLPGNPVSSFVTARLFLLPLLRALAGDSAPLPRPLLVTLGANMAATGKRREFIRASFDGSSVVPLTNQDSGALSTLAAANALIDRPANAAAAESGISVPVFLLDNGGFA